MYQVEVDYKDDLIKINRLYPSGNFHVSHVEGALELTPEQATKLAWDILKLINEKVPVEKL